MTDTPEPEVRAAVISIVWDWENETVEVTHDGLNHFEAIGLLTEALSQLTFPALQVEDE